jgi:uncharacterized protein with FMN-binding domain
MEGPISQPKPLKKNTGIALGIGSAVLIVLIIIVAALAAKGSQPATDTVAQEPTDSVPVNVPVIDITTTPVTTDDEDVTTSVYKDGTYTATGHYVSPAGPETIGVTLTLKDDVVTAVEVETHATNPNTANYQGQFAAGIEALVVGKKIQDLHITKVSGSSLTSKGFADAIAQIETQAQA